MNNDNNIGIYMPAPSPKAFDISIKTIDDVLESVSSRGFDNSVAIKALGLLEKTFEQPIQNNLTNCSVDMHND